MDILKASGAFDPGSNPGRGVFDFLNYQEPPVYLIAPVSLVSYPPSSVSFAKNAGL